MIQDSDAILEYWLDTAESNSAAANERGKLWYGSDPVIDQHMGKLFGETLSRAESDQLDNWVLDPRSGLALVILLDQFSRNIYRGQPDAFKNDRKARATARQMIDLGTHLQLSFIGRAFLYHPFEHSELLEDQDTSVILFTELAENCPEEWQKQMHNFLAYAEKHRDIIRQFNRFPHRNAVLGRESTEEEVVFLEKDKRSWGQAPKND